MVPGKLFSPPVEAIADAIGHGEKEPTPDEVKLQIMLARVRNDFVYHPPKAGQTARYEALRHKALELAELIVQSTPAGREQSSALTRLEECIMHANAGIARNE